ncbi:MAG: ABC-F family ATP-binding cassette domain-containing protein, partial [Lachnospiraceae bacterium]|nr:ABC-F family ATP-binding cassette domain-containing protein [Lachnospiraceae bacterium]
MAQIEIKDMTFYYDDFYHPVFEHLTVNLDTDWKMALVGRNGRGKSTLLKLLEGSLTPSSGEIKRSGTVSYFPYLYDASFTKAMDVVKECIGGLRTLELKLQKCEDAFCNEQDADSAAYYEVLNRYLELDGYAMESRICKELSQMGLSEALLEQDFDTLSGGEQTCMLIIALFLRKDT